VSLHTTVWFGGELIPVQSGAFFLANTLLKGLRIPQVPRLQFTFQSQLVFTHDHLSLNAWL
jgi:hypothetical protein